MNDLVGNMLRSMFRMLLLFGLAALPAAASLRAAAADATWTVEAIIETERIAGFELSPEGTRVVWERAVPDREKDKFISHLFPTDLATTNEVQLTRGKESCHGPRWSADGRRVAFLSARPDPEAQQQASDKPDDEPKDQLWVMDLSGGEPQRLTKGDRGIRRFQWRDASNPVFSAQEATTLRHAESKRNKDKSVATEDEDDEPPVRQFTIGIADKKMTRLSNNQDRILSFAIAPDGTRVVVTHGRSLRYTYDHRVRPAVWLHDVRTGEPKQNLGDKPPALAGMVWSPDSSALYLAIAHSTHPVYLNAYVIEAAQLDLTTLTLRPIELGWERGLAGSQPEADSLPDWFAATADGFIALLADGVRKRLARFTHDGNRWSRTFLAGEHVNHLDGFRYAARTNGIVYAHSRANVLPQLFSANLEEAAVSAPRAITKLNERLAKQPVSKIETVHWRGANNVEIEGLLHFPPAYREGERRALLLMIHGGPHSLDSDSWRQDWAYAPSLFTSRGAFVLRPNYQGSFGYGLAFSESIADGKYYDLPVDDILKCVDSLIARGFVDPEKIGTLGWSNGAILTMALVTRDQRFKAASAGAGGVEWTADTAACEFGLAFNDYYFGTTPWADPKRYRKLSRFWQLDRVTTPVLIFQGLEDSVVPPHHAWMQFRGLQEHGKAPVRMIQLPGERHSLEHVSSQRRKLPEEQRWFDRYLFANAAETHAVLKQNSPLANALRLRAAARDGTRFGRFVHGELIPETVRFDRTLEVGRFEVTAAQFAQFDPSHRVDPGRDNYPANGITFEQARAYCQWLSTLTAEHWRLPAADEADRLYARGEEALAENTLDHWSSYRANPEDAAQLRLEMDKLGGTRSTLAQSRQLRR
jgi:dipeptidyl aminopeptidase/acylaminoacyl peptidase